MQENLARTNKDFESPHTCDFRRCLIVKLKLEFENKVTKPKFMEATSTLTNLSPGLSTHSYEECKSARKPGFSLSLQTFKVRGPP